MKRIHKKYRQDFLTALVDPGPDIVILDEGHIIKNETSMIIAMIHQTVQLIQT